METLESCISYNLTVFVIQSPSLPTDIPFAPWLYGRLLDQGGEAMAALFGLSSIASQVSYPPRLHANMKPKDDEFWLHTAGMVHA